MAETIASSCCGTHSCPLDWLKWREMVAALSGQLHLSLTQPQALRRLQPSTNCRKTTSLVQTPAIPEAPRPGRAFEGRRKAPHPVTGGPNLERTAENMACPTWHGKPWRKGTHFYTCFIVCFSIKTTKMRS